MGMIAAFLPPPQLNRLRSAVLDQHEIVACENWEALARVCEREPVRLAIIDLFADGSASFENLRQLKVRLPRLAVICYVAVTLERVRQLFDAGRQGVDALLIFDDNDSPVELVRTLAIAESRTLADGLRRSLRGLDSVVYDAVLLTVTRAHERLSPLSLAKRLAIPRRTLSQRLAAAGFPPPQRLLTWGRLIVAAHILEDSRRPADRVAAILDFPSGGAFRNTCQRYLHATPSQIRSRGGAQYVIRAFFRQVHAPRPAPGHAERSTRRLALAV